MNTRGIKLDTCSNCGEQKKIKARGLCGACYSSLRDKGALPLSDVISSRREQKKKKCESCECLRFIHARGVCKSCYVKGTTFCRTISGKRMFFKTPFGKRDELEKVFDETRKNIIEDLLNNPKKWLKEASKKEEEEE